MKNEYKFKGNIIISGKIKCETGLHIGGIKEKLDIGGVDAPVIRDARTNLPYIPGSSLKGKMRSLLEWDLNKVDQAGKVHQCSTKEKAINCEICRVFGHSGGSEIDIGPTRLIVRDSNPTIDTIEIWGKLDTGLPYTEPKTENVIDRLTSQANPRTLERVPKGSVFGFEMVYSIYDLNDGGKKDLEFFKTVATGLRLVEDSFLGGSGTRGYGKVKFENISYKLRSKENYQNGEDGITVDEKKLTEKAKEHFQIE